MANPIDYGPLQSLIGSWRGDKGVDSSPEPEGSEESPYYETLVFTPIGDVENAESQVLAVLRYQQIVRRKSNGEVFHDQTGYWIWDAREGVVMQSIAFRHELRVADGILSYSETTSLEIYGRSFEHMDENRLTLES